MNYHSFLKEKLKQLKDNGSYRYFPEVNRVLKPIPNPCLPDKQASRNKKLSDTRNDETEKGIGEIVKELLADKLLKMLPLFECVQAFCRGRYWLKQIQPIQKQLRY